MFIHSIKQPLLNKVPFKLKLLTLFKPMQKREQVITSEETKDFFSYLVLQTRYKVYKGEELVFSEHSILRIHHKEK